MKLSKIALAAAALCGMGAASAQTVNIYVSGATAQDSGLESAVIAMCNTGTFKKYTANNSFLYDCAPNLSKILLPAGTTRLLVAKHSQGGSGNGVAPVNNATPLPFLDITKVQAVCGVATPATPVACSSTIAYNSTTISSTAVAQVGISDLEPSFFGPATGTYDNLKSEALATVIFGVPVTKTAYLALQAAQGLTRADGVTPCNGAEATGSPDFVSCMPSLGQAQVTSMFTQVGQSWSGLTGAVIPGGDDIIYVARRAASSGTQKTYEAVIARTTNTTLGGKNCQVGVDPFVEDDASEVAANNTVMATYCSGVDFGGKIVSAGSGSSQVAFCLNTHNDGGRGAVGVLTTESATTVASGKFFFVKVNGVVPSDAGVQSGAYTYYGDASLNTLTTLSATSNHGRFKTALKGNFAITPVVQPYGNAGLMTLDAVTGSTGGNPWSRLNAVGNLNNCQSARAIF